MRIDDIETSLDVKRLKIDLLHAIRQFNRHAFLDPLKRNNCVVNALEEILNEAKKMQLEETQWQLRELEQNKENE